MTNETRQQAAVGQAWRFKATLEVQPIERVDKDGMIWVRSWAFLNGFPPAKFYDMYEYVGTAA